VDNVTELPVTVDTLVFAWSVDTVKLEYCRELRLAVIDVIVDAVSNTDDSVDTSSVEVTVLNAVAVLPNMVENRVEVVIDSVFPTITVPEIELVYIEETDKVDVVSVVPITVE
jgi:hypothetical protein